MAYRRKQQTTSSSTYSSSSTIKATKLANENKQEEARIRNLVKPQRPLSVTDADALHTTSFSSRSFPPPSSAHKDPKPREYTSVKSSDESKHGFWGVLARKARAILDDDEDDGATQRSQKISNTRPQMSHYVNGDKYHEYTPHDSCQRTDRPALKKGLNALTSSINYIGNAVEGGLNVVENRTAGLIKETRKHIRRKPGTSDANNQATDHSGVWQQHQTKTQMPPQTQTDLELQLKASRDVAMAMAAKSKLLLRELKTVKADLAFAKERCAQLEEENKILRDNRDRGDYPEDDEMIRLQLETLLTEKARLAHENSVYARENRFLREIVEYHQLTMQDVVYLDEKAEEVSEVYPIMGPSVSDIQSLPTPAPLNASS